MISRAVSLVAFLGAGTAVLGAVALGMSVQGPGADKPVMPARATAARTVTARPIRLGMTPAAVLAGCARLAAAKDFPVLCPTRLPLFSGTGVAVREPNGPEGFSRGRRDVYDIDYLVGGRYFPYLNEGHMIVGGSAAPFDLRGSVGRDWVDGARQAWPGFQFSAHPLSPVRGGPVRVYFRIIARARVGAAAALVLRAPPFTSALSIHGGHLLVLWNKHGHGYFVSMHGPPTRAEVEVGIPCGRGKRCRSAPEPFSVRGVVRAAIGVGNGMRAAGAPTEVAQSLVE